MEDASRALLMSAGVLIAIILMGLAVNFFRSASSVTKAYDQVMQAEEMAQFNSQFTKFLSNQESNSEVATIYDIVSCANYAYNFNNRVVDDPENTVRTTDPVILEIAIEKSDGSIIIDNLQKHREIYTELIKQCYYANTDNPNANNTISFYATKVENNQTGRVNYVRFSSQINIDARLELIKQKYNI